MDTDNFNQTGERYNVNQNMVRMNHGAGLTHRAVGIRC